MKFRLTESTREPGFVTRTIRLKTYDTDEFSMPFQVTLTIPDDINEKEFIDLWTSRYLNRNRVYPKWEY